jgi:hypothetical protein
MKRVKNKLYFTATKAITDMVTKNNHLTGNRTPAYRTIPSELLRTPVVRLLL